MGMAYTQILSMDLLAFFLAVVSCLGLLISTITFLRTYTPTNLYLYAADSVAQTRILYDILESEDLFSSEAHRVNHLRRHLDLLEDNVKVLMFVIIPTSNIAKKLSAWLRVWQLLYLAYGADKLRIGLRTISHQRRRLEREVERAQRHGLVEVDLEQLEADVSAAAEMFISSLTDSASSGVSVKDLFLFPGDRKLERKAPEGDWFPYVQPPPKSYVAGRFPEIFWKRWRLGRNSQSRVLLPT